MFHLPWSPSHNNIIVRFMSYPSVVHQIVSPFVSHIYRLLSHLPSPHHHPRVWLACRQTSITPKTCLVDKNVLFTPTKPRKKIRQFATFEHPLPIYTHSVPFFPNCNSYEMPNFTIILWKLIHFSCPNFEIWVQNEEAIIKVAMKTLVNIKVYSLDLGISFPM